MARIAMKCSCGWSFFVGETTPGWQAMCPNCGNAVPIPGRAPGKEGPRTPGHLAAEKVKEQRYTTLLIGIVAAIVLVGIVLVVVLMSGGSAPEPPKQASKPRPVSTDPDPFPDPADPAATSETTPPKPAPSTPPKTVTDAPPPRPVAPALTESEMVDLRTQLALLIRETNMTAIVAEVCRLRGHAEPYEAHFRQSAVMASKCEKIIAQLTDAGQKPVMEPRVLPGDQIVAIVGRPVAGVAPAAGALALEDWLRKFRAGITGDEMLVQRGPHRVPLYLFFPEETKELLQLARVPGTLPAAGSAVPESNPVAGPSLTVAFTPELMKELQARLAALPAPYLAMIPSLDRSRFDRLLKAGMGTPDDSDFMQSRMPVEILQVLEKDAAQIRTKLGELEPKISQPTASDLLHMKDGRKIEGTIEEETDEFVRVKQRLGSVRYPRADVVRVERGRGAGPEFTKRLAEAKADPKALPSLMAWCQSKNLKLEAEYVAWLVLAADPGHDKARIEAKFPKPVIRTGPPERATAPLPAALPATTNQAAVERIEEVARQVSLRYNTLSEVITEVRRLTDGLRCSIPVSPPERFLPLLAHVANPLTFKVTDLTAQAGMDAGQSWGQLSPQERQEFGRYFGLWCAYARYSGKYGR